MAVVVRGIPLELHPAGDYLSDAIRDTGDFFEADILDEIARRITGGTLVDVGAHIGNHAAYLATFVEHDAILAFEPNPDNLALLWRNAPDVAIYPVALGDRSLVTRFERDRYNLGHSRVSTTGELVVEMTTLDSFALENVTLLKIDVEGYEPQVLAGARRTIARCRPLIVIEDWQRRYAELLPGYRLVAEWETAHQTFMFA